MAKAEILFKVIRKWEGGWSDHKNDKGGKTKYGDNLLRGKHAVMTRMVTETLMQMIYA